MCWEVIINVPTSRSQPALLCTAYNILSVQYCTREAAGVWSQGHTECTLHCRGLWLPFLSQADACYCLASSTGCYLRSSRALLPYSPSPEGGGFNSAGGLWGWGLPPTGTSASLLQLRGGRGPKAPWSTALDSSRVPAKPRPFSDLCHLLQSPRSSPQERVGREVGVRASAKSQMQCAFRRKAIVGAAPPLFHPGVPDPTFLPVPREGGAS